MKFVITYDADRESRLDEVIFGINNALEEYFRERFYDDSGVELGIVLMCRDPRHNFKQRISFSKKDNCLYMDIMLDLAAFTGSDLLTRRRIVSEKIVTEVPQYIAKYKFKEFDLNRFSFDLREFFVLRGWMSAEDN